MKINLRLLLSLVLATPLCAAPLTSTTAVRAHPDASAATIGVLNAGTEPTLAASVTEAVPAGWEAVELTGTHEVYVHGKDIAKSLDVKVGAELHTAPKADSPVFGTMGPNDTTEITGIHGKWTRIKLQKKVVGFIHTGSTPPPAPLTAASSAPASASGPAAAPAPAPAAPSASTFAGAGRPVETVSLGDANSASLPRLFQGTFASTRRPLMPRRPYDFQLTDANGERYSYLDLSKLLLTEQLDKYVDHTVVVYGTAKPVPNTRDIVIEVESLQLR